MVQLQFQISVQRSSSITHLALEPAVIILSQA